jgi:hypothetical protein
MNISPSIRICLAGSILVLGLAMTEEQDKKPSTVIEGVKGVNSIRAVKGVQGIVVPKQRNLEAALLIEAGSGPSGPAAAAAAAGLFGPPGVAPGAPSKEDGRVDFQEFEKQDTPGS